MQINIVHKFIVLETIGETSEVFEMSMNFAHIEDPSMNIHEGKGKPSPNSILCECKQ